MHLRVKSFKLAGGIAGVPTADDLRALADEEFVGADVSADDIRVRPMALCHDQLDRTAEEFPKAYLERFRDTIVGKSVLPGHDTGALPLARFYGAHVQAENEQEFPTLVTRRPKEKSAAPPGFELKSVRVNWLKTQFYYPASAIELDDKLRTRVYRWVSIGFGFDDLDCKICNKSYFSDCPHIIGRWLEDGRLVTARYSGDAQRAEAREGSIVYLGAQQEAGVEKRLGEMVRKGCVDPIVAARSPIWGEVDPVTLKMAEQLAREHGHKQHSWAYPHLAEAKAADPEPEPAQETDEMDLLKRLIKALGLADTATEDEVVAAAEAAKKTAGEAEAAKADLEAANTAKTAVEAKVAELEPWAKTGKQAIADLQKRAIDDEFAVTGKDDAAFTDLCKMHAEAGNYERLKLIADQKQEAKFEKVPAGRSGVTEVEETAPAPKPVRPQDHQLF